MLLASIQSLLPSWMLDAKRRAFANLMAAKAATLDALTEAVYEVRLASLPGQLDVPGGNGFDNFDALPLIGRDRGRRQGKAEDAFSYAAALRSWNDDWTFAGTPFGILNEVARILSPNPPKLLLVNGSGVWWARAAGDAILPGAFTMTTVGGVGFVYDPASGTVAPDATPSHAWDWDSASLPPPFGKGDPSRWWLIVFCPCNLPYLAAISGRIGDGRRIGAGGNAPNGAPGAATIGTVAPADALALYRHILREWGPGGDRPSHIIFAFDPLSFSPDGSSSYYPDGTWGWPCVVSGGVMVPGNRDPSARYAIATPFGIAGFDF